MSYKKNVKQNFVKYATIRTKLHCLKKLGEHTTKHHAIMSANPEVMFVYYVHLYCVHVVYTVLFYVSLKCDVISILSK